MKKKITDELGEDEETDEEILNPIECEQTVNVLGYRKLRRNDNAIGISSTFNMWTITINNLSVKCCSLS